MDFPADPVAKTLPSSAGSAGSIPGWGAKNPRRQKTKTENRKNIVTNSIKILKMVHIKKIFFKTEGFKIQKHREEGHVKAETGTAVVRTAKECQAPPRIRRGKKKLSPRAIRWAMALLTP